MGESGTGNKADLIARALSALNKAKEMLLHNPNDSRFSVFLQYVAQENGGTLHAGYKRASPRKPGRSVSPKLAHVVKGIVQPKQTTSSQASSVAKAVPAASRPFENVTYSNSPFHEFSSRLYTKVIDGRQGMMMINDFVLSPAIFDSLSDYRIKLYMGNPMNTMPFGMAKVIDVFFSDACWITVNGKNIQENTIIPNKKKVWACVPPDITDLLLTRPGIANKIEIRFSAMIPKCMVTMELVKVISAERRVEIICEKHRHPKSQVLEEKKKSFLADDDIVATSEVITLRDPILQVKINKPGRSISCKHTQCFDLHTFFKMNERSNTFICPICNNRIKWENIILDEYFEELLKMAENSDDIDIIEIQPDGSWSLPGTESKRDNEPIKKEFASCQDEDIMIIDSDDEAQPEKLCDISSKSVSSMPFDSVHVGQVMPISVPYTHYPSLPVVACTPVLATSVEQTNEGASNPPYIASALVTEGNTEISDENLIDLTLSSDDEDTPIGTTIERRVAATLVNIYNEPTTTQTQAVENQGTIALPNNRQNLDTTLSQHEEVSSVQAEPNDIDTPAEEALEKALEEGLVQLDAPLIVQPTNLVASVESELQTHHPFAMSSILNTHDLTQSMASTSGTGNAQSEQSELLNSVQIGDIAEIGEAADASGFLKPTLNSRKALPALGENVEPQGIFESSAAVEPLTNISRQRSIESNLSFDSDELDELLSSIPDPIFHGNSDTKSPKTSEKNFQKSKVRRNEQVICSSSIDVSIPGSPNSECDDDLDMIFSSIPDDIVGKADEPSPAALKSSASQKEVNDASNVNFMKPQKKYSVYTENINYSLKVIVGNRESESTNVDYSASLKTNECVLTPSPQNSDDDDCEVSFPAKENRNNKRIFLNKNQPKQNHSKSSNAVQIEKTWTAQDEDALRLVAESIFAEMDAQTHENMRKRGPPDI